MEPTGYCSATAHWTGSTVNSAKIDALARTLTNSDCAVFIGAGFSAPAHLPTFVPLLRQLSDKAPGGEQPLPGARYSAAALRDLNDQDWDNLSKDNVALDEIQFDLYRLCGYAGLANALRPALLKSESELQGDSKCAHFLRQRAALVSLPWKIAATWNWDNLLDGVGLSQTPVPPVADLPPGELLSQANSARKLFRLNGAVALPESEPCAAVFGEDEYEQLQPAREALHKAIFDSCSVVTIGLRMESETSPYNPLGERWGGLGLKGTAKHKHFVILPICTGDGNAMQRAIEIEAKYNAVVIDFDFRENPAALAILLEEIRRRVDMERCSMPMAAPL